MTHRGIFGTKILRTGLGLLIAFFPLLVLAADPAPAPTPPSFLDKRDFLKTVGEKAQVPTQSDLPTIIGKAIQVILGLLGILLLAYLLYAGFLWMTSGGSEDNVKKAQTMIKNAVMGLVIIAVAFALTNFVLGTIQNVATK